MSRWGREAVTVGLLAALAVLYVVNVIAYIVVR